ncbi:orn/Lys/Arg decarboxylase, major domain protein [Mycobacterium xenopi 4042]|uniref:Orn/Lys/Arg decarboxylase, major domain protein n=1 Tax=Mycobacterium xenopi 4042 TaxID=1299334 RepID=X8DJ51_MYCXE|nr:orn/Lys/Arg decarboxylase, major domain protein [Mycobacterium xenopi 4042]
MIAEVLGHHRPSRPYFELLVVATMTEAQEHALANEIRSWRRPDDAFIYEIVVVGSGDEAVIAARLNSNVQACAITRRFSHRSRRDLSALEHFCDAHVAEDLADHSPEERAEILAKALRETRPEIDLYLITELEVEDVAARLGHHFRRVFHAGKAPWTGTCRCWRGRGPIPDAILQRVARIQPPAHRVFHALPISQASRSSTRTGSPTWCSSTDWICSWRKPRQPAAAWTRCWSRPAAARRTTVGGQDVWRAADLLRHQRHLDGQQGRRASAGRARRYRADRPQLPPVPSLRADDGRRPSHLPGCLSAEPVFDVRRGAAARDQVSAAGVARGRQAGTGQAAVPDQLHLRRDRVRRRAGDGGMSGNQADLVFLWDEAWFAFARFHHVYRRRTAMHAARVIRERLRSPEYRQAYRDYAQQIAGADDETLLNTRLLPDPARARVRVYATQSTHKTLTSLRQGSMIHVFDQDFDQKVQETFHEAYMAHTSTSPNYQILASLDIGRRQADLEGMELVQKQVENAMQLRDAIDKHPLLSKYMHCLSTAEMIPQQFRPSGLDQPLRSGLRNMATAWEQDEFVLDPSRITLYIGPTGIDGDTFKRTELMDRYGVQINKTSRNTVLFMTNIGTTRSSVAYLVEILVKIAQELDDRVADMSLTDRAHHERAVLRLTTPRRRYLISAGSTHASSKRTATRRRRPRTVTCAGRSTSATTTACANT